MRYKKITGIILSRKRRLESDISIIIFTSKYGKISLIAKGARTIRSRRSFHLDLCNIVDIEAQETKSGLYVREVNIREIFPNIVKSTTTFGIACLALQFLMSMMPYESRQPFIFSYTKILLKSLDKLALLTDPMDKNIIARKILQIYFLKCMRTLGYIPTKILKKDLSSTLFETLSNLDPQFTLYARRTLGIFCK